MKAVKPKEKLDGDPAKALDIVKEEPEGEGNPKAKNQATGMGKNQAIGQGTGMGDITVIKKEAEEQEKAKKKTKKKIVIESTPKSKAIPQQTQKVDVGSLPIQEIQGKK